MELVNRETNFTKVFAGPGKSPAHQMPQVGFINPLAKVCVTVVILFPSELFTLSELHLMHSHDRTDNIFRKRRERKDQRNML